MIDDASDLKASIKAMLLDIFGDKETAMAMLFQMRNLHRAVEIESALLM